MPYIGAGLTRFNTADELTVTGDAQIDTTTLVVDSTNNRVGVGTASPATALDVTGTATVDQLDVDNIRVNGNTISSTDTNGDITLAPNGTGEVNLADSDKLTFGAGSDLQIYHDGNNSLINDVGTGDLRLRSNGSGVIVEMANGNDLAQFLNSSGEAKLMHNGSEKLATTSTGVSVTGDITANNLAVSNTPVVTARKGGDQTITRNTWTKITAFTTNEYDSDSAWNGSRFTVPSGKAGRYLCIANVRFKFDSAGSDGEQAIGAFYVNGGQKTHFFQLSMANGNRHMGIVGGTGSVVLNLAASDYVEVYGYMQDDSASGSLKIHGDSSTGSQVGFMRID